MAEAQKPQVDELIRPVVALAGPGARAGLVGFTDRVEAVGGTLRIQSRAGRRTRHLVELPLVAPRR
jgi:glucose-6-phosphate-specific signal transduction histidine kinase